MDENFSPLGCSIMNYYKKFGQNRDLEKFLRLHRSYSNKSSSESSLFCPTTTQTTHYNSNFGGGGNCGDGNHINNLNKIPISEECFGRSLQNLSILKNNDPGEDFNTSNISSARSKSGGSRLQSSDGFEGDGEDDPIVKKSLITKDVVTKSKKGVNVNFESFIEINMPQPIPLKHPSPPPPPPLPPAVLIETPPKIESREKFVQTTTFPEEESPIVPSTTATKKVLINSQPMSIDGEVNCSPTSSIASQHRQKLEWDSGADVGYSKKIDSNEAGLSSLERNALTKLFANYGLSLDSNIILLSSKKTEITSSAEPVIELGAATDEKERRGKSVREKWRIVSEGIMRQNTKIRSSMTQTSQLDDSEMKFEAAQHSTPYTVPERKPSEVITVDRTEKFSQTSMKELRSQSVQVSCESSMEAAKVEESPDSSQSTKKSSRSPSINNDSVGKYENEGQSNPSVSSLIDHGPAAADERRPQNHDSEETDAESFEFVSGVEYLRKSNEKSDKKRQIKADDDRSVASSSVGSSFSLSKYTKNLPENYQKLSRLEKNLTVGINLMNSLLESASLSTDSKTVLIKKIIGKLEKMVKRNCGADDADSEHIKTIESIKLKISGTGEEKLCEAERTSTNASVKTIASKKNENPRKPVMEKDCVDGGVGRNGGHMGENSKKDWLKPMTHSEIDYETNSKRKVTPDKLKSTERSEKDLQLSLITANIKYLEKLKIFLENGGNAENFLGGSEIKLNIAKKSSSNATVATKSSQRSADFSSEAATSSFSWNSHANVKNKQSTRSKLETPPSTSLDDGDKNHHNESIDTFARHKREAFVEKYNRMRMEKDPEPEIKVIYTRPYSGGVGNTTNDYYSNANRIVNRQKRAPTKTSKNTAATSINSSDIFMSSMSLPPTHSQSNISSKSTVISSQLRFDMLNIGTQTSDSVKATSPIVGGHEDRRCRPTRMVKKFTTITSNKSHQITPRPIAYMLRFDGATQTFQNKIMAERIEMRGETKTVAGHENEMISPTTTTTRSGSNLFNIHNNLEVNLKRLSNDFSLQNTLIEKNRSFLASAEERRNYIHEVNQLRLVNSNLCWGKNNLLLMPLFCLQKTS